MQTERAAVKPVPFLSVRFKFPVIQVLLELDVGKNQVCLLESALNALFSCSTHRQSEGFLLKKGKFVCVCPLESQGALRHLEKCGAIVGLHPTKLPQSWDGAPALFQWILKR